MDHFELQRALADSGRYTGKIDGVCGPKERDAIMLALTDGPDTKLTAADYAKSAKRLGCAPAAVQAFATVESAGGGFEDGRPKILFEPHRFSRATQGRFDKDFSSISYPKWDPKKYPRGQDLRYAQLVKAVGLSIDAGFASASYGKFQILGENFKVCGYASPFDFAVAQAQDEAEQLAAFEGFIIGNGLRKPLIALDWQTLADRYNGTASRLNDYAGKLRRAYEALV